MRKLIVLSFITLDGVMQAPGGPEEDSEDGFQYGGWQAVYSDPFVSGEMLSKQMDHDFDLLLGRKTYDIFAGYWPKADPSNPFGAPLNNATKYVATRQPLKTEWQHSFRIEG